MCFAGVAAGWNGRRRKQIRKYFIDRVCFKIWAGDIWASKKIGLLDFDMEYVIEILLFNFLNFYIFLQNKVCFIS